MPILTRRRSDVYINPDDGGGAGPSLTITPAPEPPPPSPEPPPPDPDPENSDIAIGQFMMMPYSSSPNSGALIVMQVQNLGPDTAYVRVDPLELTSNYLQGQPIYHSISTVRDMDTEVVIMTEFFKEDDQPYTEQESIDASIANAGSILSDIYLGSAVKLFMPPNAELLVSLFFGVGIDYNLIASSNSGSAYTEDTSDPNLGNNVGSYTMVPTVDCAMFPGVDIGSDILLLNAIRQDAPVSVIVDESSAYRVTTVNGDILYSSVDPKFGTRVILFEGTGSSYGITVPNASVFSLGSGGFSLQMFILPEEFNTGEMVLFQLRDSMGSSTLRCAIGPTYLKMSGTSFSEIVLNFTVDLFDGDYHYVEFSKKGGQSRLWMDGSEGAALANAGSIVSDQAPVVGSSTLGADSEISSRFIGRMARFVLDGSDSSAHETPYDVPTLPVCPIAVEG